MHAANAISAVDGDGEFSCQQRALVMDNLLVRVLAAFEDGWVADVLTSEPLAAAQTWA
jgi:hypothetical protein